MENEKQEKLMIARHGLSHVLAKAVKNIFGKENVKLGIGPAINDGFYYDFDMASISVDDFSAIEAEMKKIIGKNEEFKRVELTKAEANKLFASEPYSFEFMQS